MPDVNASPRWTTAQTLEDLRRQASSGLTPSAQIFVHESVSPADFESKVKELVDGSGLADTVTIGPLHRLARSFSVQGSVDGIERLASSSDVKAVLPSQIDDAYPTPVNRRDL